MKRYKLLAVLVCSLALRAYAEEALLIDFTRLVADTAPDRDNNFTQHSATKKEYGDPDGHTISASLAITNWELSIHGPSDWIGRRQENAFIRETASRQWGKVMGIRVRFPRESGYAVYIEAPFEIPDTDPVFENGYGIVKNPGIIKSIHADVYGLNFVNYTVYVILVDDQGKRRDIPMGKLNFDGWKTLRWDNPDLNREQLDRAAGEYRIPDYYKFGGYHVNQDVTGMAYTRGQPQEFIVYFKDVRIEWAE